MWDLVVACKKVLHHMIEEHDQSPKCELCGKVGYECHTRLFDYLYFLEVQKKVITRSMYEPIGKYIWENYPYEDYGKLTRHHTSYEKGICMFVCGSCHGKIHNSDDPKYSKYKPIDKKPKRKKVEYKVYKPLT